LISLRPYNTFNLDHYCTELFFIKGERDLLNHIPFIHPPLIIGGGSNILLTKDPTTPVLINEVKGKQIVEKGEKTSVIKLGGGEVWHDAVVWAIKNDLGGIENLSLIPGKCGAAPIQNIGAYGVELKDVFERLDAIDLKTGQKHYFSKEECQFGYRDSIFKRKLKGQYFILNIYLRLNNPGYHQYNVSYGRIQDEIAKRDINEPTIAFISKVITDIRRSKLPDPKFIPNCGSFFKNPIIPVALFEKLKIKNPELPSYSVNEEYTKVPAGWLIEQCGWKGKKVKGVGCHENHALVLCNYNALYGREIKRHAEKIIISVHEKYGISLEPEVNIW